MTTYPSITIDGKKRFFALRQNETIVRLEEVDESGKRVSRGRIVHLQGAIKQLTIIGGNSLGLKRVSLPFEEEE